MKKFALILGIIGILITAGYYGYLKYTKKASPEAVATYESNGFNIEVTYCRPSMKGRKVFGNLVPYNQVWRTGANEATEISLSKDVRIGDKQLPAGKYSLYSIPGEKSWKIMFNSVLGQWGHFGYDRKHNVLEVDIPVSPLTQPQDSFLIDFAQKEQGALMRLRWEQTEVAVPLLPL